MSQDFLAQLNSDGQSMFDPRSGSQGNPPQGGVVSLQAFAAYQARAMATVSEMQLKLAKDEMEMGVLGEKLGDRDQQIGKLQMANDSLATQLDTANQKVLTAGTELTAKVAEKAAEFKPQVDKLTELESEVEKLTLKIGEFETQVAALTKRAETAETELAAVKKTVGKDALEKLGLEQGENKTSERGSSAAATEELTAEEAAEKARAASAGAGGETDFAKMSVQNQQLTYFKMKSDAEAYGGEHYLRFQQLLGTYMPAIQKALRA